MHKTLPSPQWIDRLPFVPFLLYALERYRSVNKDYAPTTTFTQRSGLTLVDKSVRFRNPHNQLVHSLLIEAAATRIVSQRTGKSVDKTSVHFDQQSITISRAHQPGVTLAQAVRQQPTSWSEIAVLATITKTIQQVQNMQLQRSEVAALDPGWIPTVHPVSTYLLFPLYCIAAVCKSISHWRSIIRLLPLFYQQWWVPDFFKPDITLTHRDISPQNIILHDPDAHHPEPTLIDWESSAYAEPETDLAISARLIHPQTSNALVCSWLREQLETPAQQRRFIRLSCFYLVQFLASEVSTTQSYADALDYAEQLSTQIVPALRPPARSLYELLWYGILHTIALMQRLPVLRAWAAIQELPANTSVMLCYHSISNTAWRFALPHITFMQQLDWLNTHAHTPSLEEWMREQATSKQLPKQSTSKKPTVLLSFDDGYADLIPTTKLLEQHRMKAVAFVLSEPARVDRNQLGTNLPLLTSEEISSLSSKTWTIGSHSATHPSFRSLSIHEIEAELQKSKLQLQQLTGAACQYFAYPQGYHTAQIEKAVQRAGYRAAFTTGGAAASKSKPFTSNRIIIEQDMGVVELAALLTPLGLLASKLLIKAVTIKASLVAKIMR